MAKKPVKAQKNTRKTELLTNLWQSLGGADNGVNVDRLLKSLNGERDYCVYGELDRKQRTVQVAEVGSHLVNRLGERYRAPTDEPGIAAAVMQKLSTLGNRLIAEQTPQLGQGAIARRGQRIHYRVAAVPVLNSEGDGPAWLGIVDWSRRVA
jgi:hypothetical protein